MGVLFRDLGIPSKRIKNPLKFVLNGANLIDHYHRLLVIFGGADTPNCKCLFGNHSYQKDSIFYVFFKRYSKNAKKLDPTFMK